MLHSTNENDETTCESNAQVEMNKIVQTFDELLPVERMRGYNVCRINGTKSRVSSLLDIQTTAHSGIQ